MSVSATGSSATLVPLSYGSVQLAQAPGFTQPLQPPPPGSVPPQPPQPPQPPTPGRVALHPSGPSAIPPVSAVGISPTLGVIPTPPTAPAPVSASTPTTPTTPLTPGMSIPASALAALTPLGGSFGQIGNYDSTMNPFLPTDPNSGPFQEYYFFLLNILNSLLHNQRATIQGLAKDYTTATGSRLARMVAKQLIVYMTLGLIRPAYMRGVILGAYSTSNIVTPYTLMQNYSSTKEYKDEEMLKQYLKELEAYRFSDLGGTKHKRDLKSSQSTPLKSNVGKASKSRLKSPSSPRVSGAGVSTQGGGVIPPELVGQPTTVMELLDHYSKVPLSECFKDSVDDANFPTFQHPGTSSGGTVSPIPLSGSATHISTPVSLKRKKTLLSPTGALASLTKTFPNDTQGDMDKMRASYGAYGVKTSNALANPSTGLVVLPKGEAGKISTSPCLGTPWSDSSLTTICPPSMKRVPPLSGGGVTRPSSYKRVRFDPDLTAGTAYTQTPKQEYLTGDTSGVPMQTQDLHKTINALHMSTQELDSPFRRSLIQV